jgi:hypothetical protein
VEQYACPVCHQSFEHEDPDELVNLVMEHVKVNHPDWGTTRPPKPPGETKPSLLSRFRRKGS